MYRAPLRPRFFIKIVNVVLMCYIVLWWVSFFGLNFPTTKQQKHVRKDNTSFHSLELQRQKCELSATTMNQTQEKKIVHVLVHYPKKLGTSHKRCGQYQCIFTLNMSLISTVDAILWRYYIDEVPKYHPPHQIWVYQTVESPTLSQSLTPFTDKMNWTMSYRLDSSVTWSYGKWVENGTAPPGAEWMSVPPRNRSGVAWVVSNCEAPNGRSEYARTLQKHFKVDIFGKCTNKSCGMHSNPWYFSKDCFQNILMPNYKFYLAFENTNCRHYITEKFWTNSLRNNLVPIVMGAPSSDYHRTAPPGSYIHVDDFESPKHLAEYLLLLEENDDLFQKYFDWKKQGSITFRDNDPHCRLCEAIHQSHSIDEISYYADLEKWWGGEGICEDTVVPERRWATWSGKRVEEKFALKNTTFHSYMSNCSRVYK